MHLQELTKSISDKPSLTQIGQHSPSGTSSISPFSHTGLRQDTAEQSCWHLAQHSPGGVTNTSPSSQSLSVKTRQSTKKQIEFMGIAVITPMEPASTSKESEILKFMVDDNYVTKMWSCNTLFCLHFYRCVLDLMCTHVQSVIIIIIDTITQ